MGFSVKVYREMEKLPPDIKSVLLAIFDEMDNSVKKDDFNELKAVVAELAEAQKRTEVRLESLTKRMDELAEAQKRTEERLESLAKRMDELAEAQKQTEKRLNELAEAQKKTEERLEALTRRVDELAEAQKKTEERLEVLTKRVDELAEAQKKTEESLNKLIKRVDNIEEQLGGLAMAVGYGIEDKLYPFIDTFVSKVFGVEPEETVLRYQIDYGDGKFDELNLYTECMKDGKKCLVLGECKAQVGKKDVDRFIKTVDRVSKFTGMDVFKYMIGYTFSLEVEKYIKANYPDLKYYKTYQVEHGKY